MITKIAVLGSAEFITKIKTVAPKVTNIELNMYPYNSPQEAAKLLTQLKPCDVVFFSGALPYYFSKKERESLPIPSVFLAQDDYTVSSSFLTILHHKQISLQRLSIDLMDAAIVKNVLEAANISPLPANVIDYKSMLNKNQFDMAKLVSFHRFLWENGAIDLALTSVHAVYDQLVSLGIPAMRMTDPPNSLIRGLEAAKAEAQFVKGQLSQVAVTYLSLKESSREIIDYLNELARHQQITIQQLENGLNAIFSTRGDVEALIKEGLLHNIFTKWPNEITIGFGYGKTLKEAMENAKIALKFAEKDTNHSSAFILDDKKELHGPLPKKHHQQRLTNNHPELFKIAQKAKLSPANLSKIIQFIKSRQSNEFTSADLADYLLITRRSSERMIKKLVDHKYAFIVGEEMTYQQGRPRALYALNIPIYY
ncbi:transcriptional regulator [Bacillus sp. Bva_UNVM-123]|uniref:transcriptional regulator n=1 Tax=Bacillus sp. Bva_UNVM-123 TaxID=2829798 RepID=UPI00391F73D1